MRLFFIPPDSRKESAMKLTMEQIQEFDETIFPRVKSFCLTVVRLNFDHDDNRLEIYRLARELGIDFQVLCSYVWLQIYLQELSDSFGDIPSPEDVAKLFDIPLDQFTEYVEQRTRELDCVKRAGEMDVPYSEEPTEEELLEDALYHQEGKD